jgi:hypothetical protein
MTNTYTHYNKDWCVKRKVYSASQFWRLLHDQLPGYLGPVVRQYMMAEASHGHLMVRSGKKRKRKKLGSHSPL